MEFTSLGNLNGQTAVITGANGSIGRAVCKNLSTRGAQIIGIVRGDTTKFETFLQSLEGHGHRAYRADVTKTEHLQAVCSDLDHCDILVTSAGHSRPIPHSNINEITDAFFEEILISNLRSVFSTIRTFKPLLDKSNHGLIINIGSASVMRPGHGSNIAYVSAKAGVEAMTKNLALALAPNIRIVSICPSSMDTGFLDHPKEFYDRAAKLTPLQRIGTPEDIAIAVEVVATKLLFITGNTLVIDGGRTL